jgi:tetratricopeptide (TPR) repeat protein
MKIKYIPLLIVLLTSCKKELEDKVVPQSSTSSSVSSSEPSKDLEWMIDLIDKERVTNPTQALKYATKLIEVSQLHKDRNSEAIGIYKRGYIQDQHLGELGKAYQDYYEAHKIFQELNLLNSVSDCYLGMAGVFYKLGEYKKALDYYQKLLQNAEKINNKEYRLVFLYWSALRNPQAPKHHSSAL